MKKGFVSSNNSLWYPFTPMLEHASEKPLNIARAEGCYLFDSDGNRYLDGISSLWTNIHGHNHAYLNQAIREQLDRVAHSTLLGLSNEPAHMLAGKLVEITPAGLNKVFYSDSGSTAVEIALKQSFQYWQQSGKPQKTKFIHLDSAYHGDTLGAVSVGGIDIFHQIFGPILLETLSIPCPTTDFCRSDNTERSIKELTSLLKQSAGDISALIVEPLVQGAGGILVHPKGFLKKVERLCREFDIHLIVDEVATGFGRTGKLFACEHENVEPDFLCLAKGITGGYLPLAATLTTDRVFEAFLAPRQDSKTFFHGHTYTGNPLACAAAIASIELFDKESTLDNVGKQSLKLSRLLEPLIEHPHVISIRQRGLMCGIEFAESKNPGNAFNPDLRMGHQLAMAVRKHGVILRNLGDVMVVMPPLCIKEAELEQLVNSLSLAMDEVF